MYIYSIMLGKILAFTLFLFIGVTNESSASNLKLNFLSQKKETISSLPIQISPVLVEAPHRYVDIFPLLTQKSGLTNTKDNADIVSYKLTGLPVDLYEFPLLKFKNENNEAGIFGVELEVDTTGKGVVDAVVRIGKPSLFPDMIKESIDFNTAQFVPKDLNYLIKRVLGLVADDRWNYTFINNKLDSIVNGVVSASFNPGSSLLLQRTFAPTDLATTPLVYYEYNLPNGLPWVMTLSAKIDFGRFSSKFITLSSEPVKGGGNQKLLVNFLDLLKKDFKDTKDSRLVELFIRFTLDEGGDLSSQDVRIDLGNLELFHSKTLAVENGKEILLISNQVEGDSINLFKRLNKKSNLTNTMNVLGGRLLMKQQANTVEAVVPKINFLAQYREKIPELFVGAKFLLDELSSEDLNAVLDNKTFYRKRILWEAGQSDVIFRNVDAPFLPLLSFTPNTSVNVDTYINANFIFEDGEQYPLRMTLLCIDVNGNLVTKAYQISNNIPFKLDNIKFIKKATFSYWNKNGAKIPLPASIIMRNIHFFSFDKTAKYIPNSALAYVSIVNDANPFWRANPARFDYKVSDSDDIKILQNYSIETKIVGTAIINYILESSAGDGVKYYIRLRTIDKGRYHDYMIPMDGRGEVPISNLFLRSLEIIVKPISQKASLSNFLLLKKFDLTYKSMVASGQNELLRQKYTSHNEVTYLAPHKSFNDPDLAWLRPAYEAVEQKFDLTSFHKLDATLSYSQIIGNGKSAFMPDVVFVKGNNLLNYVANEGVSVSFDPSFLKLKHHQQAISASLNDADRLAISKPVKLGILVFALAFLLLGVKTLPQWKPLLDRFLSFWPSFLLVQFVMFNCALYLMFNLNKDALSWGGLILTFAYALAVHYKLRPFLINKWGFFRERISAPYFLLFFVLLILCAVMVMLKFNTVAENIAVIAYYLLVTGVIIEFIGFAKQAQLGSVLSTKKSKFSKI